MHNVTLIHGDGIGPEVISAAKKIIDNSGVKIIWDKKIAGEMSIKENGSVLNDELIQSIKKNKVALKGPITTPIGNGFRSANVELRKTFDLYANIRPVKTYDGVLSRYENVDLVIVRENTEDLYAGIEHMINDDIAESIKIITRKGSERIVRYAFEFCKLQDRKSVTVVHKANIMKCTDGLFLKVAREIAKEYNYIEFREMIVDAMSMELVKSPEKWDVLVMPNLYGDILSDMCAGFVGGLGMVPGSNIGLNEAIFEPVHGSAPDIAGKNIANPTAAILSGIMMLRHLKEFDAASRIENSLQLVLKEGKYLTTDLGGNKSTEEFANRVIEKFL